MLQTGRTGPGRCTPALLPQAGPRASSQGLLGCQGSLAAEPEQEDLLPTQSRVPDAQLRAQNSSFRNCWAPKTEGEESTLEIPGAGSCGEASGQEVSGSERGAAAFSSIAAPADGLAPAPDSSFAVDVLRQRLQNIGEARSQGNARKLSPTSLEKRCWRKLRKKERDRK